MVKYKELWQDAQRKLDEVKTKIPGEPTKIIESLAQLGISSKDIAEAAIYVGLAYASIEIHEHWLFGPVALKLTQSGSEIGATVGVAMLAALGVSLTMTAEQLDDPFGLIGRAEDKWKGLIACEDKRSHANFLKWTRRVSLYEYPFIEGWFDPKMPIHYDPTNKGVEYLKCIGEEETVKEEEKREEELIPDFKKIHYPYRGWIIERKEEKHWIAERLHETTLSANNEANIKAKIDVWWMTHGE